MQFGLGHRSSVAPMTGLDAVRSLVTQEHGLAVVATTRADGTVQASVANAGVLSHPTESGDVVALVASGGWTAKVRNLRARPRATITFRAGWTWATVEGAAQLIGPADPFDGVDGERLRVLFREIFTAAGGTHDDFDAFDRAMADEGRVAVLVRPERLYSNRHR